MKFNILSLNQRRKTPPVTKLECTTKNIPNLFDLPLWAKTFVQKPYQASVVRGLKTMLLTWKQFMETKKLQFLVLQVRNFVSISLTLVFAPKYQRTVLVGP